MNIAFVLFAKTPGLKPVKNRLSRSTSQEFANDFYEHSLEASCELISEMSRNNPDIKFICAVEEKSAVNSEYWSGVETMWQGDGGAGDRYNHVYKQLLKDYDAVFIMGSNSAYVDPMCLEFDILNFLTSDDDFLLGKTPNGRFYLFGGKKPLSLVSWINVPYFCSITFDEMKKSLSKHGSVLEISEGPEFTDAKDLKYFENVSLDNLLASQLKLSSLVEGREIAAPRFS